MENDSNNFSQTKSFTCVPFVYLEEVEFITAKEEEKHTVLLEKMYLKVMNT